jgi:hypothetical protein
MKVLTKDERLVDAVYWANQYFQSPDFEKDILSIDKFEFCNISPQEIVKLFRSFSDQKSHVEIKCTYFGWFFKKVLGRTVGDGFAYVNSSGLDRQVWSLGATVVHETAHIVDEFFPKAEFGHGSNSSLGKKRSFPYFIDERAENWIKKEVLLKEAKRLSMRIVILREITC